MKKLKEIIGCLIAFGLVTGLIPIMLIIISEKFPILYGIYFLIVIIFMINEVIESEK